MSGRVKLKSAVKMSNFGSVDECDIIVESWGLRKEISVRESRREAVLTQLRKQGDTEGAKKKSLAIMEGESSSKSPQAG